MSVRSRSPMSTSIDRAAQARPPRWLTPARLDRLEQVVIVVLWMWLAWRVYASANGLAWLALISETAIMFFVLIRRPTDQISLRLGDWLLAITATLRSEEQTSELQSLMSISYAVFRLKHNT